MSVYPDKKNGQYTGLWRVEFQQGKQRYRKRHADRTAALEDEKRVKQLIARGESIDDKPAPLKAPLVTLQESRKEAKSSLWRDNVSARDSWHRLDEIIKILGENTRLNDITTASVDQLILKLRKRGLADATVNRYLSAFHSFLKWCAERSLLTVSLQGIVFDWLDEDEGRIRWLSVHEEAQLQAYLPVNIWKLVKVAIETGCRRGELLTVEPEQINGNKLHLWKTKTKTPRTVPMDPAVAQALRELVESGSMPTANQLQYHWDIARERMGLSADESFVFHCCRHTCATRLVESNVNLRVIQQWMGHRNIKTTIRYAHVHDEMLEDALKQRQDRSVLETV